jgi:hypothetical protein
MKNALWIHLFLAMGISTIALPALASSTVGTISSLTGNLADSPCGSPFLGSQLFFTNASIFDGGTNSAVFVLQTPSFGLPPL